MKHLAIALILAAGPAFAQEPPYAETSSQHPIQTPHAAPEPPTPVLTADEGKALYAYGLKVGMAQGMAQAAEQAAQQEALPVLKKLQPPAAPKP